MRLRGIALVVCSLATANAGLEDDPEQFKATVMPMIRSFIFTRYQQFAASELTFRHLKKHVGDRLGISYETLGREELAEVIEDATDEIANECNMGEIPIEDCKKRIGYMDAEGNPLKDEA